MIRELFVEDQVTVFGVPSRRPRRATAARLSLPDLPAPVRRGVPGARRLATELSLG